MKNFGWFLLFIIGMGSASAQSFNKHLSTIPGKAVLSTASDTLKILAVMVDFQEDKYDATIGTGKFGSHYTKVYGDTILDPLPHDSNYFSDHLLFAKNYYKRVSKGKLEIKYNVLPQVITVSKNMRDYSPTYNSNDLTPLGQFAQEVWSLADQKFSNIKFSDYNLFIIFHAGVSNGLDLGTFSIDRNMPSVYMGTVTLKKIFGNQFAGFSTKSGQINNSIILPETESREQDYVDGSTYLNQVSINGGIVNNIGNHIGLPDLFNTETGLSAIGRFGLMDAQSIGANYGLFPPEPSPWERIYLGWENAVTYSSNSAKVNIAARATASASDTTLFKVPINSSEYFLVENRQQDALKNNLVLTIRKSGQIITKTFEPDTSGYFYVTPEKIHGGVVIDVDEYDASAPGSGIVIWHVDDKIINSRITENKINVDPENKGIYVVEADGIQDIGHQFETIFGTMIGDGTTQDLWYKGNEAKYYTNKFGINTKPSTKSNSGANTYLSFENFSALSNKMSFNLSYSGGTVKKFKLPLSNSTVKTITHLSNGSNNYLFITDNTNLYKYSTDGEKLFLSNSFSGFKPASVYYNNAEVVAGALGGYLNLYIKRGNEEFVRPIALGNSLLASTAPVVGYVNGNPFVYVGTNSGILRAISLKDLLESNFPGNDLSIQQYHNSITQMSFIDDQYVLISGTNNIYQNKFGTLTIPYVPLQASFSKGSSGETSLIILSTNNTFSLMKNGKIVSSFTVKSSNTIRSFSLTQADNSGDNNILVYNGNKLEAYTLQGKLIDGFPFSLGQQSLSGIPLTIDIDGSKSFDAVTLNVSGNVYFANQTGELKILGEPISVGSNDNTALALFNSAQSSSLACLDEGNNLSIWNLSSPAASLGWTNIYGDEYNSNSAIAKLSSTASSEFFPVKKAYNWPNPVYGSSTNIRFYVSESGSVTIKIVDLSGALVANLAANAIGGTDNEISWDVSKVQSGVYYANLEVNGSSGKTANKIIKIAVVK
jgi:hypothetical protein